MPLYDLLQRLPLDLATDAALFARNNWATRPWPEDVGEVVVETTLGPAKDAFQTAHFEDASPYSLKYRGEVLNVRRPAGVADDGTPLEDHFRARPLENAGPGVYPVRIAICGHREPNRFLAKESHVAGDRIEWFDAAELEARLEEVGLVPMGPDTTA